MKSSIAEGGLVRTRFAAVCREFTLRYAGLSFYWAWVFLSFNSLDIVGGGGRVLSLVHVASSASAMVMFAVCAMGFQRIVAWPVACRSRVLAGCGAVAAVGTFLYSSPLCSSNPALMAVGAVATGFACSPIVLAWGAAYRGLDARRAVLFTSMTFFGAAVLYAGVMLLGPMVASAGVSLLPLAAAATVIASLRSAEPARRSGVDAAHAADGREEMGKLVRTALSWRVLAGLMAALFAYGGLRVYFGDLAPDVFSDPWLMAGTIAAAAFVFFLYGTFVSRTSLNLGVLYREGDGVEQDYELSFEWLTKAAEQGYADSQNDVGYAYQYGLGVSKDLEKAFEWYMKAAEQGSDIGQCNVGICYRDGIGVEQDYDEAFQWLLKAAEQGFASAQNDVGFAYQNGQGVEEDMAEAFDWYMKAAEQGFSVGQYNVGICYKMGRGVEQDYEEALAWFKKAADQGYEDAQKQIDSYEQLGGWDS